MTIYSAANRDFVTSIFNHLGNRPLPSAGNGRHDIFEGPQDAGLIAFGSLSSADMPAWDWEISPDDLLILSGASDSAVAEAHRLIDKMAEAVRVHGHGQDAHLRQHRETVATLSDFQVSILSAAGPFWAWLAELGVEPQIEIIEEDGEILLTLGATLDSSPQWQRVQIAVAFDHCTSCDEQSAPDMPASVHALFWPSHCA